MITKEQFGEWRQHPASRFFFKYLADFYKDRETAYLEHWKQSGQVSELFRGQLMTIDEVRQLRFDTIELFYEELNAGSDSGTENGQPGSD